jgi:multisubunit Na+/H+ antiporter MnhE subunit
LIVEYLKELANRADLGTIWNSWSTQYRVLAAIVALLVAYFALRSVVPAVLRMLRPGLLLVIVLLGVWALFPGETCSIELLSRLPFLCRR